MAMIESLQNTLLIRKMCAFKVQSASAITDCQKVELDAVFSVVAMMMVLNCSIIAQMSGSRKCGELEHVWTVY